MDLAKELCVEVLRDRIQQFSSPSMEYNAKLGSALADADRFLASERELCTAAQTLEVWFFKIQGQVPYEVAAQPPMLPLFLRQAIRSQLHFSPFRSWLTARKDAKPDGLFPFIRVSTSTHFAAPSDRFRCHRFPPCRVGPSLPVPSASKRIAQHRSGGEPLWLQVQVQWLKKECFLTKAPICPEMRIEPDGLWMLPASDDRCHSRTSGDVIERVDGGGEDGFASNGEAYDSLESSTPTESLSPIVRRKTKEFEKDRRERMALGRRNGSKVSDERKAVEEEEKMKPMDGSKASEGQQNQRVEVSVVLERRARTTRQGQNEEEARAKMLMDRKRISVAASTSDSQSTSPISPPHTRLFLCSSPMPCRNRRVGPVDVENLDDKIVVNPKLDVFADGRRGERKCGAQQQIASQSPAGSSFLGNKKAWPAPSRLICNFEESILNGRIPPNSIVNGFYLQLTVIDAPTEHSPSFPTTKRLTLPVLTYFFNDLMTQIPGRSQTAGLPSPLHLARCELEAAGIPVPKRPFQSMRFIRQRIFSGGGDKETGESDMGGNGNKETGKGYESRDTVSLPNAKTSSNSLRFLVHLRLASDASGQTQLHSDIRILFSNKANDLEGLESIIEKLGTNSTSFNAAVNMRSVAEMPQTPKYSPIKLLRVSRITNIYVVLATEMGGHAIVRTFAENKKLRIVEKSQMDVGRPELLTKADLISNYLMLSLLRRFPLLKVISEEKSEFLSEKDVEQYRADNYEVWLGLREALSKFPSWRIPLARITVWIDPLDATQEFTESLTQYVTVMACVAIDGKPIFGAIHSPFLNETVFGMVDHGLFDSNGLPISVPSGRGDKLQKTILVSRSHAGTVSDLVKRAFVNDSTSYVVEPAGGAGYKTLRLIRQSADLYIHTMAIKKWDLCAGDALIRSAGGVLLALDNGLPIDYSAKTAATTTKASDRIEVHKNGFLMTLQSPFSFYQRFKKRWPVKPFRQKTGVQSLLAEFRLNLARARSTSGAVGASVSDLLSSEKELEPAVW
uniref:inositol-phosphate phosphatase n=1 Tax=Globodera pallida TaxID=36090 RepID=A0A183C1W9_GLOPA